MRSQKISTNIVKAVMQQNELYNRFFAQKFAKPFGGKAEFVWWTKFFSKILSTKEEFYVVTIQKAKGGAFQKNQKEERSDFIMQTPIRIAPKLLAIAMAIAMALTMAVSAFAVPYNNDATQIIGSVSYAGQSYSVTVNAPPGTTKINVDATLYQKTLLGRKEIDTMTSSSNSAKFVKSKSVTIEKGKTYILEVTADVYSGGSWDTLEASVTAKT